MFPCFLIIEQCRRVGPPNKIQQRALPFLLKGADIIAQAPPTQERIAAYVIPAIQIAVTNMNVRTLQRGPIVIMVSTTVDQATQAQRMIRDLGGPVGIRSALGVGSTIATSDLAQEIRLLQQKYTSHHLWNATETTCPVHDAWWTYWFRSSVPCFRRG